MEQWQSVEEVGADYDILLEPFNEYCDYVSAHCALVKDVEAEAITETELNADEDVETFVRDIYDKAKESFEWSELVHPCRLCMYMHQARVARHRTHTFE